jgi:chloramphenicol O-acetyltransferase type A
MPKLLDLDSWHRRHHFAYFKQYELPFFNVCGELDVSCLLGLTHTKNGPSFSMAAFYAALRAANDIEPLRYRIRDDAVLVHDVIHGGTTVLREDRSFGFAYFDYLPDFSAFAIAGQASVERSRARTGELDDQASRDDLIHFSVVPWISFSSISHARRLPPRDSIPKIVFGKHHQHRGRRTMPVSVEVHHALVDGLDVGEFFARLQSLLEDPEIFQPRVAEGGGSENVT